MSKYYFVIIFFGIIILCRCNSNSSQTNTPQVIERNGLTDEAQLVAKNVFESIKVNQYSLVQKYYSKKFYSTISVAQWEDQLRKNKEILGDLIEYELFFLQWDRSTGTDAFVLTYHVKYSKHNSDEKISLVKEGSEIKIIGHNITTNVDL